MTGLENAGLVTSNEFDAALDDAEERIKLISKGKITPFEKMSGLDKMVQERSTNSLSEVLKEKRVESTRTKQETVCKQFVLFFLQVVL